MSIKNNLSSVIKSMTDFSSRTNIVAINAAIHASKLHNGQGAPFQILVQEIQRMSAQSNEKLDEIRNLIKEIGDLSVLINRTGGQRMLLMKMVNAKMMDDMDLLQSLSDTFKKHLTDIQSASINSATSHGLILEIESGFRDFKDSLQVVDSSTANTKANDLITKINELIHEYEKYAGH